MTFRGSCEKQTPLSECDEYISGHKTCNSYWNPVCGTNGVTYKNKCGLEVDMCRDRTLQLAHEGFCGNCEKNCTVDFNPVFLVKDILSFKMFICFSMGKHFCIFSLRR